jgi:nicotinate-nucleotide pyrophosphorylase (carboxylating)
MAKQFRQVVWDEAVEQDLHALATMAMREDLGHGGDITTEALIDAWQPGRAAVVARRPGVIAGLRGVPIILQHIDAGIRWTPQAEDGQTVVAGQTIGILARCDCAWCMLAVERTVLNFLGRLSGIATRTREYVDAVAGTAARIYDTRKTTPGWRRLEKYAVRCGGGWNHRAGLWDAILIKDNHLAIGRLGGPTPKFTPAEAVSRARQFLAETRPPEVVDQTVIEIEVERLEELDDVLRAGPDVVLLDNMSVADLRTAVLRRNALAPQVELEASGGITLANVRDVAATGVERISIGELTHSAPAMDLGMDWLG